jgi:hypothetical protein
MPVSLDLRTPLRAHAEWIARLRERVYEDQPIDPEMIQRDDVCRLGRWLIEQAPALRHLPEFEAARVAHAAVHTEAARLARLMEAGHLHEAKAAIENNGRVRRQSAAMVRTFTRLGRRIALAQAAKTADAGSGRTTTRTPPED